MSSLREKMWNWIDVARWAPSGGNAQNWHVEYGTDESRAVLRLSLLGASEESRSLMDVGAFASVAALGGFAFSLTQAAANDGFKVLRREVTTSSEYSAGFVELEFAPDANVRAAYTCDEIRLRRTDRRPYKKDAISKDAIVALGSIAASYAELELKIFSADSKPPKTDMVPSLSRLEKIRWQHAGLLDGLLKEISFGPGTPRPEIKIASNQLGVSKFEELMLRALKNWRKLRVAMNLGFHVLAIYRAISVFVHQSGQVCFITLKQRTENLDFEVSFNFGACLQHLWLETHRRGLAFQPLGLPLIAFSHWRNPSELDLDAKRSAEVSQLTEAFRNDFGIDFRVPTIGFRIGQPPNTKELAPSDRGLVVVSEIVAR